MRQTATPTQGRRTAGILPGIATPEGDGILVYRPFPSHAAREIDPFLLLDRLGPVSIAPGGGGGVPPHPHAGFEVVSYILQGGLEHRDSAGHHGRLAPGDVQWMTAGAGIIHSEMPTEALRTHGGTLEAIQLWINLPARDKQMPPRYGDIPAAALPTAVSPDGLASVRVIAGEALGARASLPLRTPITYLHWTLAPGAVVHQPLPEGTVALAYVLAGEAHVGSDALPATRDQLVTFRRRPRTGDPAGAGRWSAHRGAPPRGPAHRGAGGAVRPIRDEHDGRDQAGDREVSRGRPGSDPAGLTDYAPDSCRSRSRCLRRV